MKRRSVTRIRTTVDGGRDQYGDPIPLPDEEEPGEVDIPGCLVAPRLDGESHDPGRAGVIIGKTLYAPQGADIRFTDRFSIDGSLYEVEGEPGAWEGSQVGGVEVALKRWAG